MVHDHHQYATHCEELIEFLTTGASPTATGPMNPNNLRDAKGLLFLDFSKTGLVLGVEHTKGFMITLQPDGSWSPPVFVTGTGITLGLTAGHSTARTLVTLFSDKSIKAARKPFKLGIDFNLTIAKADMVSAKFIEPTVHTDSASFSHANGLLVDLSLSGMTVKADAELNAAVYGADATPDSILSGSSGKAPAEFERLYTCIEAAIAKAGIPGQAEPAHTYGGVRANRGDWQRVLTH